MCEDCGVRPTKGSGWIINVSANVIYHNVFAVLCSFQKNHFLLCYYGVDWLGENYDCKIKTLKNMNGSEYILLWIYHFFYLQKVVSMLEPDKLHKKSKKRTMISTDSTEPYVLNKKGSTSSIFKSLKISFQLLQIHKTTNFYWACLSCLLFVFSIYILPNHWLLKMMMDAVSITSLWCLWPY